MAGKHYRFVAGHMADHRSSLRLALSWLQATSSCVSQHLLRLAKFCKPCFLTPFQTHKLCSVHFLCFFSQVLMHLKMNTSFIKAVKSNKSFRLCSYPSTRSWNWASAAEDSSPVEFPHVALSPPVLHHHLCLQVTTDPPLSGFTSAILGKSNSLVRTIWHSDSLVPPTSTLFQCKSIG